MKSERFEPKVWIFFLIVVNIYFKQTQF